MDDILIGRIKTLIYTDTYAKDNVYTKYINPVNHWIKVMENRLISNNDYRIVLELRGISCDGYICTGNLTDATLRLDIDNVARSLNRILLTNSKQNFYQIVESRYNTTQITLYLTQRNSAIYFDYMPIDLVAIILSKLDNTDVDNYCMIKYKYCDKYIWRYILNAKYGSYINEITSNYKKYLDNVDYRGLSIGLNKIDFNSEVNSDKLRVITFDEKNRIILTILNKIKLRRFYPHLYELIKDNDALIASTSLIPTLKDDIYYDYFKYGTVPVNYEFDYGVLRHSLLSIILLSPEVLYDLTGTRNFKVADPYDRNLAKIAEILER